MKLTELIYGVIMAELMAVMALAALHGMTVESLGYSDSAKSLGPHPDGREMQDPNKKVQQDE